ADRREAGNDLQQLLRVRLAKIDRRRRPGVEDPSVDGQDRWAGRKTHYRRRGRPVEKDAARGAALSPPLRRGVVDGGAVDRLPDGGTGRLRQAAGLGEIRSDGDLSRPQDRTRPEGILVSLALC